MERDAAVRETEGQPCVHAHATHERDEIRCHGHRDPPYAGEDGEGQQNLGKRPTGSTGPPEVECELLHRKQRRKGHRLYPTPHHEKGRNPRCSHRSARPTRKTRRNGPS